MSDVPLTAAVAAPDHPVASPDAPADPAATAPACASPAKRKPPRIKWYRCRVGREDLSRLNKRSDFLGFAQTLGFLAVLASTATLSIYSFYHWPWYVTVLLTFLHGTFWPFLVNGFHELVHDSVFKTKWLNGFFLRIFAFLGWHNHHWFWASHTEHHKYTLHDPDDLEVVLPMKITLKSYFSRAFIDFMWPYQAARGLCRRAFLRFSETKESEWTRHLFPPENVEGRRKLANWARIQLLGHGIILGVSIYMHWWMVPVVITLAPMYGKWLHFLCNESQHAGLKDKVPDFRLCCRTIYLNPFLRFMYWHMNYHTEHHMFAAVPCYRLGALHKVIKDEMPPCPSGLVATWRQIGEVLRKQKTDPSHCYLAPLPANKTGAAAAADEPSTD